MAVIVNTSNPAQLLAAIKKQIVEKKIETWADEENYFTHKPPQWYRKAWFRANTGTNTLTFLIVPPNGETISTEIYAVYHGRFIEMLLAHFDKSLSQVAATAFPVTGESTDGRQ